MRDNKKIRSRGAEFLFRLIVALGACAVIFVLFIAAMACAPLRHWVSFLWLAFFFSLMTLPFWVLGALFRRPIETESDEQKIKESTAAQAESRE